MQVEHVLGQIEDERYLQIALFQGVPRGKKKAKMEYAMGQEMSTVVSSDPTLVACALNRSRFYLFSRREPEDVDDATQVLRFCTI
jgi:peptidylprolyl isomerase domain and WD repeat-containing protein 1